jgi:hypothetical protein
VALSATLPPPPPPPQAAMPNKAKQPNKAINRIKPPHLSKKEAYLRVFYNKDNYPK